MPMNPLEQDEERNARIRERAYHLWQSDGGPPNNDLEFWERARELIAFEDSVGAGQLPLPTGKDGGANGGVVEEASIQQNLGEFPDPLSDQGERVQTPQPKLRHEESST